MNLLECIVAVVIVVGLISNAYMFVLNFKSMPKEDQLTKIKEWLLWAVVQAEKQLGAKTGQIKLRYVYDMFLSKFPALVNIISFEQFSELVDEALDEMKHLMSTNNNIKIYVKG